MKLWPDLRELLTGIDWMLVGGVATRAYMPERMTNDMDIVVREVDRARITAVLENAGWSFEQELSVGGAMFQSADGIELDVLFGKQAWLDEAFKYIDVDPAGFPVISLPYLTMMKMNSGRLVDLGDVAKMLGWNDDTAVHQVRETVARWSPDDLEDLESMIMLGRLERGETDDI